jgi:hypothetical protein
MNGPIHEVSRSRPGSEARGGVSIPGGPPKHLPASISARNPRDRASCVGFRNSHR